MSDFPFVHLPLELRYLIVHWRKRLARQHHYERFRKDLGEIHESFCHYLIGNFYNLTPYDSPHRHSVSVTSSSSPHYRFHITHTFTTSFGQSSARHSVIARTDRDDINNFYYDYTFGHSEVADTRIAHEESYALTHADHKLSRTVAYGWHQHFCPAMSPPDWASGSVCGEGPPELYISDVETD